MKNVLPLLLLFFAVTGSAQFGKNCEIRQLKFNFISPGFEYELGLGVNSTLDIRAAWQLGLDPFTTDPIENYDFFPALTVQTRFYHNFEKRFRNGRQSYGNSGNFIAPTAALLAPGTRAFADNDNDGAFGYAGVVYGIQRSYDSGFSFSIDAGPAYYLGAFEGGIYPVFNVSIGWIISEKRWCLGR